MTKNPFGSTYTIREASLLCGLPESTLRYYESIGLIHPIRRDHSSKHRVYSEDDVGYAVAIACLNATGMSLEDMRVYLKNRGRGVESAEEQVALLEAHRQRLAEEARFLEVRQRYVATKIAYWKAVACGDQQRIEDARTESQNVVKVLRSAQVAYVSQGKNGSIATDGNGARPHSEEDTYVMDTE
jgi:DNA-binding transcriptional MerR regulator